MWDPGPQGFRLSSTSQYIQAQSIGKLRRLGKQNRAHKTMTEPTIKYPHYRSARAKIRARKRARKAAKNKPPHNPPLDEKTDSYIPTARRRVEPLIPVEICRVKFPALLDSGSDISLLGDDAMRICEEHFCRMEHVAQDITLAAGGTKADRAVTLNIKWRGGKQKVRFIYLPKLTRQVILGRDFIGAVGIIINIREA